MRDLNEFNITQAVLESFESTPSPRLKEILTRLVPHLHSFIRETEPTFEEWQCAVQFLARTGQLCSENRQEFILLSDILGISMLVDAINHRLPEGATESTVQGPFFVERMTEVPQGIDISGDQQGEKLYVDVQIASLAGEPLSGAVVDVWQSNSEGYYDLQLNVEGPLLRAKFSANDEGCVRFWSIVPSSYPIANDGPVGQMLRATGRHPWRPAHLHFRIVAEDYETLITHLFVQEDPYLDSDTVFAVKHSLVANYVRHEAGIAPDGKKMCSPWRSLNYQFKMKRLTRG